MKPLRLFIAGLLKHLWASLSCAAFTVLTVLIAALNKGNTWVVVGSGLIAAISFIVAAFQTWLDEHKAYVAECAKNQIPEIRGQMELATTGMEGISTAPEADCHCDMFFDLSLCNHRPVTTTLQDIEFDGSQLNPPVEFSPSVGHRHGWFPAGTVLAHGLGVSVRAVVNALVKGTTHVPSISLDGLRVYAVDAFGNRHPISMKQGQTVELGYEVISFKPDITVNRLDRS